MTSLSLSFSRLVKRVLPYRKGLGLELLESYVVAPTRGMGVGELCDGVEFERGRSLDPRYEGASQPRDVSFIDVRAGVPSLLLDIPNLISSSSSAGLPSRSNLALPSFLFPPRLLIGLSVTLGRLGDGDISPRVGLFRQVSKQSAQLGRPRRSTIGRSPIFLPHPLQLKHFRCQTRPPFSTKPPSDLSISTGR